MAQCARPVVGLQASGAPGPVVQAPAARVRWIPASVGIRYNARFRG